MKTNLKPEADPWDDQPPTEPLRFSIYMPASVHNILQRLAVKRGKTRSGMISQLVREANAKAPASTKR